MGIVIKAPEEGFQRFVQHSVVHDDVVELIELAAIGQFAVEHQIGNLNETAVFRQLFDGIAAVEQQTLLTVKIGQPAVAARSGEKTGIIGEIARFAEKPPDVDGARSLCGFPDRKLEPTAGGIIDDAG